MGMILIFFWGLYIAAAVGIYFLVKHFILNKWVHRIVLVFLILLPTYDIIITNVLGAYYCKADPNPKTFIKKKVEYPESIYWEDNVYPGFDNKDRMLMVKNLLDGVRIKKIALNSPDGRIYEYYYANIPQTYIDFFKKYKNKEQELKAKREFYDQIFKNREKYPNWKETREEYLTLKKEFDQYWLKFEKMKNSLHLIENVITLQKTQAYRFIVRADMVPLNFFNKHFIYADEVQIFDTYKDEIIAQNRRYMRRMYNIFPSSGGRYYFYPSSSLCGYAFQDRFDEKIFGSTRMANKKHGKILNFQLRNRHEKGEF